MLFSSARSRLTSRISPWCATLVWSIYPRPRFGLLLRGEAVRVEPAQYISMRAPETTVVVPNGSHYRDSQYRGRINVDLELSVQYTADLVWKE